MREREDGGRKYERGGRHKRHMGGDGARQRPVPQEVYGSSQHPIPQDERRREEEADGYEVDATGSDYIQEGEGMDNMAPPRSPKKTKS